MVSLQPRFVGFGAGSVSLQQVDNCYTFPLTISKENVSKENPIKWDAHGGCVPQNWEIVILFMSPLVFFFLKPGLTE